jgi:predicted DNA-binding transcriptional regulator AlpA
MQFCGMQRATPKRKRPLVYDPQAEIVREKFLPIVTGMSNTTIWRWRRAGKFVSAIQLGPNSLGFKRAEIMAWLEARRAS